MGNICPIFKQSSSPSYEGPTERSGLIANQHIVPSTVTRQRQASTPAQEPPGRSSSTGGNSTPYSVRSVDVNRAGTSDNGSLAFDKIGLDNLDKRLADIGSLFNNLLERYSNLKTGLLQLEHIAREICAKLQRGSQSQAPTGGDDVIGRAFACFAHQIAQSAETDIPISLKLKEHAKNWVEANFDSKCFQYEEISFLNLYNLLSRYAWELRSKVPPLRNTVAMTTQEEETFRRDLLVASLNSEANSFGANFARLRRVDEQLGMFERLGSEAGEKLSDAARKLMA